MTSLQHDDLPVAVLERLPLVLVDLAGVTIAGTRTPELRALAGAWSCAPGETSVPRLDIRTTLETSAYLAAAACCLELDEGNKYPARSVSSAHRSVRRPVRRTPMTGGSALRHVNTSRKPNPYQDRCRS